jgi:hypothetical protein
MKLDVELHADETNILRHTLCSVFEGIERAARGLKKEVLKGLCNESTQKEQALREAAKAVAKRSADTKLQLAARKKEVDVAQQVLIKAATKRCDELRATLEAAATEKVAALDKQQEGLEKGAGSLKTAREGAKQTLSSLVVEERPIEVVTACLRLKKELATINQGSQAKAPVREANLHTVFSSMNALVGEVRQFGWSGALDVDVTKCTLSKQGEELLVQPGRSFEITLTTRDKLGQQLTGGGAAVKAAVEPQEGVDGGVAVEDMGDGTYVINFKSKEVQGQPAVEKLSLSIDVCGSAIQGSPFPLLSSPSSIVTTQEHMEALHGFVPGWRLELCYRASRDGWTAADFHRLCDNRGPTLVVAKERLNGYIFGGYTAVAWTSSSERAMDDNQAFIFSISNPSSVPPVKMPYRNAGRHSGYHAVYHRLSKGPVFGNGGDLTLLTGNSQEGNSNLGYSYSAPSGQGQFFLTGLSTFGLAEMEVFLVK